MPTRLVNSSAAVFLVAFVLWQGIAGCEFPLVFNPPIPILPPIDSLGRFAILLAGAAFAVSLTRLKPQRLLAVPSIADRNQGSQEL